MLKTLNQDEILQISGGVELAPSEMANAYMMAGSMVFPGIFDAMFKQALPFAAKTPILGATVSACLIGFGTGVGVYVGYQLFHYIYDDPVT